MSPQKPPRLRVIVTRPATGGSREAPALMEGAMVEIRKILCPTDFSDASRHALEHAIVIAKWYDAQITALHVLHTPLLPPPPILAVGFADTIPPRHSNYEERERQLHSWLEPARQAGVMADGLLDEGEAARRILHHAQSDSPDLLVMGTQGLSGFDRFMLGSVTEKVVRKAHCAVLTVPPTAGTTAQVPYTRILCPVDFSPSSLAAFEFACSLAEEADARLTILHVFEWPDDVYTLRFDTEEYRRAAEAEAAERLETLVPDEARVWSKPSTKVAHGKPYREILSRAEQDATDLIVMGVRGRSPLDMALFGSTVNQVVRRAPCPVLTLRP
jgi:nucleotide-binding universal stress UspA family protein